MLPDSWLGSLSAFEGCFTAPSYRRFVVLMRGWLVCIGKHTVTGVMRAAGVAEQDVSGFHRFFSRGAWDPQEVGFVVLRLALHLVTGDGPIALTLDDTLARHTGNASEANEVHHRPPAHPRSQAAFARAARRFAARLDATDCRHLRPHDRGAGRGLQRHHRFARRRSSRATLG